MSRRTHRRRPPRGHDLARRARPRVEYLEDRCLLDAGSLVPIPPDLLDAGHILISYEGDAEGVFHKLPLAGDAPLDEVLARLRGDPNVRYAERDFEVSVAVIPNDTNFGSLWGPHNIGQSGGTVDADIDAPQAWDITTGSTKTVVGVIDTGIDYRHPDLYLNVWINQDEVPTAIRSQLADTDNDGLITFRDLNQSVNQGAGKITDLNGNGYIDGGDLLNNASDWENGQDNDGNNRIDDLVGWNFVNNSNDPLDDNNHGTHVAGTIGAIGNNARGVAGVNWNVQLAALKFLRSSGSGSISNAVAALNYAVGEGIKISNNSWGGGGFSTSLSNALTNARDNGHVFVAAAGNSGRNNDSFAAYPASYSHANILAVAATDRNDDLAGFSNYGATRVDLGAPGVSIVSTIRNGGYASFSGTSMATPHVAGVVALVRSQNPTWTYQQVIDQILDNVDPISSLAGRTVTGGRLNAFQAVNTIDTAGPLVTSAAPNGTGTQPVSAVRLTFNEAIAVSSFTTADVTGFTGPGGALGVTGVQVVAGSGDTQFDVTFASQSVAGVYSFFVGPDITDKAGNQMNQDQDAANGESIQDRYQAQFTIDADSAGARVTAATPNGSGTSPVSAVRLTFNEAIAVSSFTTADVTLTGPGGPVAITGVQAVAGSDDRQFDVTFASQSAPGAYTLAIGPDVLDQAGNAMNQNQNGVNGEVPGDRFTGQFTIQGSSTFTFNSPNVPVSIRDYTLSISNLTVGQDLTIGDLNARLNISHTYDSDLHIYLFAPDGNYTILASAAGGSGNNFQDTVFDDEASTPISFGQAPFAGSYRPEFALSTFDGRNARGTWELWVIDYGIGDTGAINSWSLIIEQASGGLSLADPAPAAPAFAAPARPDFAAPARADFAPPADRPSTVPAPAAVENGPDFLARAFLVGLESDAPSLPPADQRTDLPEPAERVEPFAAATPAEEEHPAGAPLDLPRVRDSFSDFWHSLGEDPTLEEVPEYLVW